MTAIIKAHEPEGDGGARPIVLRPVVEIQEIISQRKEMIDFAARALKEGVDYGVIPGTNEKSLWQSGAQLIGSWFGLAARFECLEADQDRTGGRHEGEPFYGFRYRCILSGNGFDVGEGIASCNSWEIKYRYRQEERKCPECEATAIIKGKEEWGGGWLCWKKRDGCGAKFPDDFPAIVKQSVGRVRNPDVADQVNTIEQMAQKRSFVRAIRGTSLASGIFTQDIEDQSVTANGGDRPPPENSGGSGAPLPTRISQQGGPRHPKPAVKPPSPGKVEVMRAVLGLLQARGESTDSGHVCATVEAVVRESGYQGAMAEFPEAEWPGIAEKMRAELTDRAWERDAEDGGRGTELIDSIEEER